MFSLQLLGRSFFILLFTCLVIHPILWYVRDPLKLKRFHAPNLLAAITPLWLIHATWSQRRSKIIHTAFKENEDVIRVSPTHLVFRDPAAIKDIYGVLATSHGVNKDTFYDRVAADAHDLVQLRDRGEHSERRKALANAFAAKSVVNMESVIRNAASQLLERLDAVTDESINLRLWLNFFTLDVIGDMGFGLPMGFLETMSDTAPAETQNGRACSVPSVIDALHRGVRYSLTIGNIPSLSLGRWIKTAVALLIPLAEKLGKTCGDDFENICISKLRQRISKGAPARPSGDFMEFILKDTSKSSGEAFSSKRFSSLIADTVMMMNAGSDTTAAALTSTLWFLLSNPAALARLRSELHSIAPPAIWSKLEEDSLFEYDVVKNLPFLRACIDESLRLRPPIAYQLPRLVSKPVTIAGHHLFPGTVVGVAPWSVHRHPNLFRDPDEYRPDRWIEHDESFPQQREHLKQFNVVFSQGSRACIGRHLAIVELQILVSTLVMRYDINLVERNKDLEIFERFNSNPGAMAVTLRRRNFASEV